MPEERIIPAVQTVAEFTVKVNGTELPRTVAKLYVNVTKAVNKVAYAKLVVEDGDASTGTFPQSDGDLFVPGNEVEILAGDPDHLTSIFKGIIIKQSISIKSSTAPQLVVECRHKAVRLTVGRKSAVFHSSTDSDALNQILEQRGISGSDVADTSLQHEELVQYNCTDWDFIVARAEQAGMLVLTNNEQLVIKKPDYSTDATLSLLHGSTIINLDAEIDSRHQFNGVKTEAWDAAAQAVVSAEATTTAVQEQGDFVSTDLADVVGLPELDLRHGASLKEDELATWAEAQLQKSRGAKVRGRVKLEGLAGLNPGDLLDLSGIGRRFSGKALVTGVRHDFSMAEGWKTQAQFGVAPEWFVEESNNVQPPKAGGLLPGVVGLHTGIVTDNEDPEGEMRVRVRIPFLNAEDDGVWARIAQADAGENRGLFYRPQIGDEVVLGFLYDDPRHPVILGMLNSSALPAPLTPSNDNHQKGYTSRSGMKLHFDDEKKSVLVETPAGNTVLVSEESTSITIKDQQNNKVVLDSNGITVEDFGSNQVTLAANSGLLTVKGTTKVVVDAPQIELVSGAAHPLVFGDSLLTYLNQLVQMFNTHMHPGELALGALPVTPAPPVPPMPPATPSLLSLKVKTG